jgi:SOS-response transcriptional repressor LexA
MIETTETIYRFLEDYADEHGGSPTVREIAAGCFVSVGTVMRHLDRMENLGWISRQPGKARSIRLLREREK